MLALAREAGFIFAVNDEHRIMLAPAATETWESACMGGRHETRQHALVRLAHGLKADAEILRDELLEAVELVARQRQQRQEADAAAREADAHRRQAEHARREALRASLSGAKFKRQTVALSMREGIAPEAADAWVYQGLAVHRRAGCGSTWYVSQVSSGLALGLKYEALGDARLAVARLAPVVDWVTAKPNSLTRNLAVRDLVSRVRHGDPLA